MDYIQPDLAPLVQQLRARYPGVRIVEALRGPRSSQDPLLQQTIRYQAPLELLKQLGLVTEKMIRQAATGRHVVTPLGDCFMLWDHIDCESRPGQWDLTILTEAMPRERERVSVREAQRVLRAIARGAEAGS